VVFGVVVCGVLRHCRCARKASAAVTVGSDSASTSVLMAADALQKKHVPIALQVGRVYIAVQSRGHHDPKLSVA
jgi:hypothetical protein